MRPKLLGLQTAAPPYVIDQREAASMAQRLFSEVRDISRLINVFANSGIRQRYSCAPMDWYEEPHGWVDRTALYQSSALDLLETVARNLLDEAGLEPEEIDTLVVVSTTGIATPSLDALLVERMRLRRDIQRLPVFGLGCAGGVIGLSRAAALAKAEPGSRVMFLVVELCTVTFRKNDAGKSNIVASALFGDGCAGALLSTEGEGPAIGATLEHTWPDSLDIMGWEIEEDGLKARFAQSIPTLVANNFRSLADEFLRRQDITLADIDGFACHPGGAKVLDALEDALDMQRGDLAESRAVLAEFGNMSAVTVLFVAQRMALAGHRTLLTALGPGFSAAFLMLDGR